jgi:hypothetical protein
MFVKHRVMYVLTVSTTLGPMRIHSNKTFFELAETRKLFPGILQASLIERGGMREQAHHLADMRGKKMWGGGRSQGQMSWCVIIEILKGERRELNPPLPRSYTVY